MGCGISRPGTNEESEATRPIRRRIEELKRRSGISCSTPSRKQLLPDDRTEVDEHSPPHSPRDDSRKSVSSKENKEEMKVEKEVEVMGLESDNKAAINTREEKNMEVEKREGDEKGHSEEEDDNGEHDEDGFSDVDGHDFAPGSPSFREYYVASVDTSMDAADSSKDEDGNDGEKTEKKKRRNQSIASSEGSVTALVKKEHKGRRFGRGLPKGSQAAVKNLLNVKSCYTPCGTPHENSQIHNVKVTAA